MSQLSVQGDWLLGAWLAQWLSAGVDGASGESTSYKAVAAEAERVFGVRVPVSTLSDFHGRLLPGERKARPDGKIPNLSPEQREQLAWLVAGVPESGSTTYAAVAEHAERAFGIRLCPTLLSDFFRAHLLPAGRRKARAAKLRGLSPAQAALLATWLKDGVPTERGLRADYAAILPHVEREFGLRISRTTLSDYFKRAVGGGRRKPQPASRREIQAAGSSPCTGLSEPVLRPDVTAAPCPDVCQTGLRTPVLPKPRPDVADEIRFAPSA